MQDTFVGDARSSRAWPASFHVERAQRRDNGLGHFAAPLQMTESAMLAATCPQWTGDPPFDGAERREAAFRNTAAAQSAQAGRQLRFSRVLKKSASLAAFFPTRKIKLQWTPQSASAAAFRRLFRGRPHIHCAAIPPLPRQRFCPTARQIHPLFV